MAFIPEEEEGSQESGMNVLASGDTQQPQPSQNQDNQSGQPTQIGGGQSSTIQGGQAPIGSQVGQAPTPQGNTRKKQGSGMFTNIRNYVRANQQGGQRLADAVSGNISQQAQDIRGQIEKQQDKFQQSLAQNQANLQKSQTLAQEAVQKAGTGQLSDQDVQQFRDFAEGKTRFDQIQPINLMQQRAKASALQNLAQKAGRATGREELLRRTFSERPGQTYTRGQRGLDALILGGDATARDRLASNVRDAGGTLTDDIRSARRSALTAQAGFAQQDRDAREAARSAVTAGQEGVQSDIQAEVERQRALLTQQQEDFREALRTGTLTREQLETVINQDAVDAAAAQFNKNLEAAKFLGEGRYETAADLQRFKDAREIYGTGTSFFNTGSLGVQGKGSGTELGYLDSLIRGETPGFRPDQLTGTYGELIKNLDQFGLSQRDLGEALRGETAKYASEGDGQWIRQPDGTIRYQTSHQERVGDLIRRGRRDPHQVGAEYEKLLRGAFGNLLGGVQQRSSEDILNDLVTQANTQRRRDLGDFLNATDVSQLTAENVVTDEQIARQNALARLAGREGTGVQQRGDRITSPGTFDVTNALGKLGVQGFKRWLDPRLIK